MNSHRLAILICTGLLVLSSTVHTESQRRARLQLASDDEIGATRYDRRIVQLERDAIEQYFSEQMGHLYQSWISDDTGQPERAAKGAAQARRAYIRSINAIDQRTQKLDLIGTMNKPPNGR